MKILISAIIGIAIISSACAGTNKHLRKNGKTATENMVPVSEVKQVSKPEIEIKEVEERLIPVDEKLPDPHKYFVIIGSFRNPDNAKKYQGQILNEGFSSVILRNEEGLYRVSVLATNEINIARDDIRRIRSIYPKYFDTWLLIQKK